MKHCNRLVVSLAVAMPALFYFSSVPPQAADLDRSIPAPASDPADAAASETAVLAGGCFWGQQGGFEHVKGVTKVAAGYSGGSAATAFYPIVGTERTGHAESVEITFDPKLVSFGKLLQIYFS